MQPERRLNLPISWKGFWWISQRLLLGALWLLVAAQIVRALFPKHPRGDLGLVLDAATRLRMAEPLYIASEYLPHTKSPLATFAFLPLTYLPVWLVDKVWDAAIIIATVWLFAWCAKQVKGVFPSENSPTAVILAAFLCTFNPLNNELAFGQFNLFLLLSTISAVYLPQKWLGGALFTFSLIFKPTQILFVPWIFLFCRNRVQVFLGGCGLLVSLAVLYGFCFGWEKLVSDHVLWWASTAAATPFHLRRPDNYGLPSLFVTSGMPASAWIALQILGLALAVGINHRQKDRFRALALSGCLVVLFSPMAWLHVYVLTVPWLVVLWGEARSQSKDWLWLIAIAAYYWGTQIFNPTTEKVAVLNWMFFNRPPLVGLVVALAIAAIASRRNPRTVS
jgi:hypothetical protein